MIRLAICDDDNENMSYMKEKIKNSNKTSSVFTFLDSKDKDKRANGCIFETSETSKNYFYQRLF